MIPRPALLLGWAGVIPFAGLALAALLGLPLPVQPSAALVAYGAAILSFMGGAQWGITADSGTGFEGDWTGYAISVLPALVAWPSLFLPLRAGLLLQIAGFLLLLAYDLWTVRSGLAPRWYGTLRIQLTAAAALCLAVAALA